jgi:hypothetical protein
MRLVTFCIVAATVILGTTAQLLADPPATLPPVPALVVGDTPPERFVVDGVARFSKAGGLAFRVATDGTRQLCAVYDPADGTPLFLSDGQQTLIYDLANTRVVLVPHSRAFVRVEWNKDDAKPLSFQIGVGYKTKVDDLKESNSWFRVDRFVEASAARLKPVDSKDNLLEFSATRDEGSVETIQFKPGETNWLSFASKPATKTLPSLELKATHIGQRVPESLLSFPAVDQIPPEVHLTNLDEQMLPAFVVLLKDGQAYTAKVEVAAAGTEHASEIPEAVRESDKKLGAAYRAALAEQGVRFASGK